MSDPAIYDEAERDWKGWWERQARELEWFAPWRQALDESNPPFYKWFVGGKLNVSFNCLDRTSKPDTKTRSRFTGVARKARSTTPAMETCTKEVQRIREWA